jgi:hypothetical protein
MPDEKIPGGYMLVAKKIFNSELMKKPPLYSKLFLWMLGQAAFKDTKKLKRGEFITSIPKMQEAMSYFVGYRKEVPTVRQIRKVYEGLTKGHTTVTTKVTGGLKITILKYDYYQTPKNYEGHDEGSHDGHTKVITEGSTPIKEKERKKKDAKPTNGKVKKQYGEYVMLTPGEHERLTKNFGESKFKWCLDKLDNYIGQNPEKNVKKYTSHRHVLQGWVAKSYEKENPAMAEEEVFLN